MVWGEGPAGYAGRQAEPSPRAQGEDETLTRHGGVSRWRRNSIAFGPFKLAATRLFGNFQIAEGYHRKCVTRRQAARSSASAGRVDCGGDSAGSPGPLSLTARP